MGGRGGVLLPHRGLQVTLCPSPPISDPKRPQWSLCIPLNPPKRRPLVDGGCNTPEGLHVPPKGGGGVECMGGGVEVPHGGLTAPPPQ